MTSTTVLLQPYSGRLPYSAPGPGADPLRHDQLRTDAALLPGQSLTPNEADSSYESNLTRRESEFLVSPP